MSSTRLQKCYNHNKRVFEDLKPGDRVQFQKNIYSHWAIFIGNGKIAHLVGADDDDQIDTRFHLKHKFTISGKTFNKAKVCIDDFWAVVGGHKAFISNCDDKFSPMETNKIVERAKNSTGLVGYNVIYSNCEHFATWCRYDVCESSQVNRFLLTVAIFVAGMSSSIGIIVDITSKRENLQCLISWIYKSSNIFAVLSLIIIYSILGYLFYNSGRIAQPSIKEVNQIETCSPVMQVEYVKEERKLDIDMSQRKILKKQNTSIDLTSEKSTSTGDHETQVSKGGESNLHKHLNGCKKNPGHRQFIPVDRFTINHLPEGHRDNDLYDLIKVTADLTVRVGVKMTSPRRPEFWPDTKFSYPFYNMRGKTNLRCGSGMVSGMVEKFTDGVTNIYGRKHRSKYTTCWCKQCKHSDTASHVWWEFNVYTATGILFDDTEASHTSLRWFYDRKDSPVVSVDQVSVYDVNIERDTCKLRCVTCDKNLGDKLNMLWEDYEDISRRVFDKYLETRDVDKLNFIASHPHGCSKHVSIGHWVDRYKLGNDMNKFIN
ncbi:Phospholipase A and acyltransferase 3 [Bulinus truncatus]|nr:Phospholipase A and acyltransferase 3 [Bulinus truncatus]